MMRQILLAVLGTLSVAGAAVNPLVTRALDIGNAPSLPWLDARAWDAADPSYDARGLADAATALLTPQTSIPVRMETLRRAVVYGKRDATPVLQLRATLESRVITAEETGAPAGLAWFDLGYLIETMKQAEWLEVDPFHELNGYALVRRAIRVSGEDPQMHFAAALIIAEPAGQVFFFRHLNVAIEAAQEGSLLAKNLLIHFPDRGKTLSELKANKHPRY